MDKFHTEKTLDKRILYSTTLRNKHPTRVPVIIGKSKKTDPDISQFKYLIPVDINVGAFIVIIRKQIKIEAHKAIFVFIDNSLVPMTKTFDEIYSEFKHNDGFLYINYTLENTFG
jgi:GABA(A) receptor-associated protein